MKKVFILAMLAAIAVNLCACYDNTETDTLATVMAVGIDGKGKDKTYTFAVADTGGISDKSKGDGAGIICFSADAPDVMSAIKGVDAKTSKKLSFSHLSVVLFSAATAGDEMMRDVDYFQQKVSVRPQTLIAVTESSTGAYLSELNLSLEANPERYFENTLRKKEYYVPECSVSDFVTAYHTGSACTLPLIPDSTDNGQNGEEITQSYLAIGGKSVARIDDNWLLGLVLSTKAVRRGFVTLQSAKKTKIDVSLVDNTAVVKIKLFIKSDADTDTSALGEEIEQKLASYARDMCDVIDITTLVRKNFRLWEDYKNFDLNKMVRTAVFDVEVQLQRG